MTASEPFDVRVWAADLADHERGRQFQVHAEAAIDGDVAWRSASTYLHRSGGGGGDGKKREEAGDLPFGAIWQVPGDIGRRYAAVSGDRNPIHMHPLSAKLFGMKAPIAHGMWTKARCLAALEGELPDTYTVDVRFKLPIFLPSKVVFDAARRAGGWDFNVASAKDAKPHLSGELAGINRA
jgi:hypothetical protein